MKYTGPYKIVEVEMLAFGDPGEIRSVGIPPDTEPANILDEVYHWGQNDFQPQQHPSVSMGDVIRHDDGKYIVCSVGFKKLTDEQYADYLKMERRDRHFYSLLRAED